VIALAVSLVMINWRRGQVVVTRNRIAKEGSLDDFLDSLPEQDPPLVRLPGVAIFLNPSGDTTPLALHAQVEHTHTLHRRVLIVSIDTVSIPHVDVVVLRIADRANFLCHADDHRPDDRRGLRHPVTHTPWGYFVRM
jgi:K+ transporter